MMIRHNGAERFFSHFEMVSAEANPIYQWFDDLHNNIVEGEWREAEALSLNAAPLLLQ